MTDTSDTNGASMNEASSTKSFPQFSTRVLAQYIRDISFENMFAQNDFTGGSEHQIALKINLDTRKRSAENQYEVITKLVVASKSKKEGKPLFLLELEYAGIFGVENIQEDYILPYLYTECARTTFPFVRRIAMDTVRDAGFPTLNLDGINFHELCKQELKRQSETGNETPPQV